MYPQWILKGGSRTLEYIFYGAFPADNIMRLNSEKFVERSGGKILFYIDDNPEKFFNSLTNNGGVFPISYVLKYPKAIIVVLFYAVDKAEKKIRGIGANNVILSLPFLGFGFPYSSTDELNRRREWTIEHEQKICEIYNLKDSYTSKIIAEITRERKYKQFCFISDVIGKMFLYQPYYSDSSLNPQNDVTVVDCGAYVGDTLCDYIDAFGNRIKKIYAFEFAKSNYLKLVKEVKKQKIGGITTCIMAGVSDKAEAVYVTDSGNPYSHASEFGEERAAMIRLDDSVKEVIGSLCIKMDVEGYEVAAIKGAAWLIKKYHPYLVVCIYHKLQDILDVPKTIREIDNNYEFFIRGGKHLECYAIPKSHFNTMVNKI